MGQTLTFGKYDGMDMLEVAELDPHYLISVATEKGMFVPQDAYAKAVQKIDRGAHWDYDDEQRTIVMQFHDKYHEEDYE